MSKRLNGPLECASPLAGVSLAWSEIEELFGRTNDPAGRTIVVAKAPRQSALLAFLRGVGEDERCDASSGWTFEKLTAQGIRYGNRHHAGESLQCLGQALELAPNSEVAHYNLAVANGLVKNKSERIRHFRIALEIKPDFWEAHIGLIRAFFSAGNTLGAEHALDEFQQKSPPLPVQIQAALVAETLFENLDRPDAVASTLADRLRAMKHLRELHAPLVAPYEIVLGQKVLGEKLEALGRWSETLKLFEAALGETEGLQAGSVSSAVRYRLELGSGRVLRKLGRETDAGTHCGEAKTLLARSSRELEDQHWGGPAVVGAEWQISCGSFAAGVRALLNFVSVAKEPHFAYETLALAFRLRGQARIAREYAGLAERSLAPKNQAALALIAEEAEQLSKEMELRQP
ncbi:MAG: hypothetical protein K2X03_16795 [Bryobacteraceae bacterium]|nr:hypothetical protein [Bryobacteraceae bacterium]